MRRAICVALAAAIASGGRAPQAPAPAPASACTRKPTSAKPLPPPTPPNTRSYVVAGGYTYPDDYPEHESRCAWRSVFSDEHQRTYYANLVTGETSWERPAELAWRRLRYHPEL